MSSSRRIPYSDDHDLAEATLTPLVGRHAARLIIDAINEIRRNAYGYWQAAPDDHGRPAHVPGSDATTVAGAIAAGLAAASAGSASRAGEDELASIPDRIAPIVGWRAWKITWGSARTSDDVFVLSSLHFDGAWKPGQPVVAQCDIPKRRHMPNSCACELQPAPADNCRCGLYAARELSSLEKYVAGAPALSSGETLVVGRVALWGRVVVYDDGWRAQFAYPQAFYIAARGNAGADVMELLNRFAVPILDTADLRGLGWTGPAADDRTKAATFREFADVADAPGLDPAVAATPLDANGPLGIELAAFFGDRRSATRMLGALRRKGVTRLGQALALSVSDITCMSGIGDVTVERFGAWRIAQGYGSFPAKDVRGLPSTPVSPEPAVAEEPEPAPNIPNTCKECGTSVMAYRVGPVLCNVCREINRQLSPIRSAAKTAAAAGMDTSVYDDVIAKLESQRPGRVVDTT